MGLKKELYGPLNILHILAEENYNVICPKPKTQVSGLKHKYGLQLSSPVF